jgi:hypothetical protein
MPHSFLINTLKFKKSAALDEDQLSGLTPELCQILSSDSAVGGEVLHLLSFPSNLPILEHVVECLGGLGGVHSSHWLYTHRITTYSNECPVMFEPIDSATSYLYVSGGHLRYISQTALSEIVNSGSLDSSSISCPINREDVQWLVPLTSLDEGLLSKLIVNNSNEESSVQEEPIALTLVAGDIQDIKVDGLSLSIILKAYQRSIGILRKNL